MPGQMFIKLHQTQAKNQIETDQKMLTKNADPIQQAISDDHSKIRKLSQADQRRAQGIINQADKLAKTSVT
jgi:hypothetical protein